MKGGDIVDRLTARIARVDPPIPARLARAAATPIVTGSSSQKASVLAPRDDELLVSQPVAATMLDRDSRKRGRWTPTAERNANASPLLAPGARHARPLS
jgi:hypothetical protein